MIEDDHSDAHNEMDNVAALAESIQPKGNTLLTTSVSLLAFMLCFILLNLEYKNIYTYIIYTENLERCTFLLN